MLYDILDGILDAIPVLVPVFIIGAITLAVVVGSAHMEAKAFNKVTGKNVSTWDAIFLDLRVQEEVK
jgi:hypothetical protein